MLATGLLVDPAGCRRMRWLSMPSETSQSRSSLPHRPPSSVAGWVTTSCPCGAASRARTAAATGSIPKIVSARRGAAHASALKVPPAGAGAAPAAELAANNTAAVIRVRKTLYLSADPFTTLCSPCALARVSLRLVSRRLFADARDAARECAGERQTRAHVGNHRDALIVILGRESDLAACDDSCGGAVHRQVIGQRHAVLDREITRDLIEGQPLLKEVAEVQAHAPRQGLETQEPQDASRARIHVQLATGFHLERHRPRGPREGEVGGAAGPRQIHIGVHLAIFNDVGISQPPQRLADIAAVERQRKGALLFAAFRLPTPAQVQRVQRRQRLHAFHLHAARAARRAQGEVTQLQFTVTKVAYVDLQRGKGAWIGTRLARAVAARRD